MSTLWWAITTFGLSVVLVGVAIFIFGWPAIIGTKVGRLILMVGGAVLFVITVFLKGRAEGEKVAKKTQEKIDASFIDSEAKYRDHLTTVSDDELDGLLLDHRNKGG